ASLLGGCAADATDSAEGDVAVDGSEDTGEAKDALVGCYGESCNGQDVGAMGCDADATTVASSSFRLGATVPIRPSLACNAHPPVRGLPRRLDTGVDELELLPPGRDRPEPGPARLLQRLLAVDLRGHRAALADAGLQVRQLLYRLRRTGLLVQQLSLHGQRL